MPRIILVLLLLCASAGLLGGTPIITVETTIGGWETSSTFATVQDFGMDDHWDDDNWENNFMVFYQLEAQGTPWSVSAAASTQAWDNIPSWYDFWSDSAAADVVGDAMIIGGSGTAYVEFLLDLHGDGCASFAPLGVQVSACNGEPLEHIPFRFNEPFAYGLHASASLPDSWSFASVLGILVTDRDGRVMTGAQLVPGDYPVPGDTVPEPSTWLITASGGVFLAWRSRRR